MFYTEKVASETTINLEDRRQCEDMMDRIYKEDTSKWPHGLHMSGFDGGCYMIREASSGEPIGFTGWQEKRAADGKKVGYYSIGILPEYRRNGYAKAAVSELLREKSANVHRVEAFIARGNTPSEALANRLGVDVVYDAHTKRANWGKVLGSLAGGVGNTALWDYHSSGGKKPWEGEWDSDRRTKAIVNGLLGLGGGFSLTKGFSPKHLGGDAKYIAAGAGTVALSPAKDWLIDSLPAAHKLPEALEAMQRAAETSTQQQPGMDNKTKLLLGLAGVLGAGGLGYMMHRGNKATEELADATREQSGGRVKLTLPTKDPNDVETRIDMPMHDINLSNNIKSQISRDTRRRLREEGKERTKRKWKTKKLKADTENDDKDKDDKVIDMPKAASHIRALRRTELLLK